MPYLPYQTLIDYTQPQYDQDQTSVQLTSKVYRRKLIKSGDLHTKDGQLVQQTKVINIIAVQLLYNGNLKVTTYEDNIFYITADSDWEIEGYDPIGNHINTITCQYLKQHNIT